MSIEFKVSPDDNHFHCHQVLIDNEVIYEHIGSLEETFSVLYGSDKDISIENTMKLFEYPLEKIPSKFIFEGYSPVDIDGMNSNIYFSLEDSRINRSYSITYSHDMAVGNLKEFQESIETIAASYNFIADIETDSDSLTIELRNYNCTNEYKTLLDCLKDDILNIKELDNVITKEFVGKSSAELFINKFNFPPDYKVLCTQYLVWFEEVLSNLNIEADVWAEPDNGGTKLIISYERDTELLERIKELFYQYIQLPYAEFIPASNNFSLQQRSFVTSLEAQLSSHKSQIQLKDATIALQLATVSSKDNQISKLNEQNEEKQLLIDNLEDGQIKIKQYSFFNDKLKFDQLQPLNKSKTAFLDLSLFLGEPK